MARQHKWLRALNWETIIAFLSLISIALHFALRGVPSQFYGQPWANIPLLFMIGIGGAVMLFQIAAKMLKGNFGVDLLAAVSLLTAAWLGENLAAVLIILMLSGGQALESFAMRRASSVLKLLAQRVPSKAHRQHGAHIEDIALSKIAIGDEIVMFPHETAPVDGVVIEGHGAMNESYLTGEPYMISKAPGAAIISGAINGESVLVMRADKRAKDSRYAQIMQVMEDAEQKRPNLRRLGDQIGTFFTPLVLIFALGVLYFTGDSTRFLAVLVVATPCPLLIAIPVTIISAISKAAQRGIIIKDPTVLERLPTCRTAIFDKTGTLTYGQPELMKILPAEHGDADTILQYAASLEQYSTHPLANAILAAAKHKKLLMIEANHVSEKPGQGLTGQVAAHEIAVTSRKKLLISTPEIAPLLPPTTAGLECVILMDGQYAATFQFRDAPRADGRAFIQHLRPIHKFKKLMLLSGDRESEVAYLAKLLGITNMLASQSPEQKVAIVRAETAKAPTLFMGDGINDAPALACATVGIAFGQHSGVTSEAAGVVIIESTLGKVDELLHISISMRRIALQSAIGGMVFSLVAMGFASVGYITPVQGALLQEAIDVLAILNALRMTWGGQIQADIRN